MNTKFRHRDQTSLADDCVRCQLPQSPVSRFSTLKLRDHRDIAPGRKHRPFAGDEKESSRILRSMTEIYRRLQLLEYSKVLVFIGGVRHEGVKWQATRPSNELSRYELMISAEPMNPGIATGCKFMSVVYEPAAGRCSHLFREAQAQRDFKPSIRLGPQDHEWKKKGFLAYSFLPFVPLDLARLSSVRGEAGRT